MHSISYTIHNTSNIKSHTSYITLPTSYITPSKTASMKAEKMKALDRSHKPLPPVLLVCASYKSPTYNWAKKRADRHRRTMST